jgi:hypothetical protein
LNASIQRQITNSLSLQVAYVGSLSHNEPFASDLNYPLANATATASNFQVRRPMNNPARTDNFGTVFSLRSDQTASYNGLQISAVERLSHHLSFNAWYVYSNTFDSVQLDNNTAQGGVEDYNNLRLDRGPADFDIRHQAVVSMIFQPDYYSGDNGFVRNAINGWSIAPIFSIHTGVPFSVSNSIDANFDGNTNDRAQLIGDPHVADPNVFQWFNTAAFAQNNPATGQPVDGNASRNAFRSPGFKNLDLAIFRTFKLTERFNMEFRAEASNALNVANYNTPNATVAASNFGKITGATGNGTGSMRQLQLGLRLTY